MINFTEIQQFNTVAFDHYLRLPGYSTSFLKKERGGIAHEFVMTDKIRVGSIVDAILTDPAKVDMADPNFPFARNIAIKIKETFGDMFKQFIPQVSFTAIAEHKGFKMPTRGRLDFLLPKMAVIDLKVTYAKDIEALIKFMRYGEQMFLYCKMAGVTKAYLLVYCVPTKKCSVHFIDCSGDSFWWEEKITMFGTYDAPAEAEAEAPLKIIETTVKTKYISPAQPSLDAPLMKPNNDFLNGK